MNPLPRLRSGALAAALCLAPAFAAAQITYFERPPTPDQLRAALRGPAVAPTPAAAAVTPQLGPGHRTRGIVWQLPAGAAQDASAAAPAAVATAPAADAASGPEGPGPAAAVPINFDLGSSRLSPTSIGFIESIAAVLRNDPSMRLVIEGHTDARGTMNRNFVLSWERAMEVYRVLVEQYGIEAGRLQPIGKGPTEPMPGTSAIDGANRRVQFRISG